MHVAAERLRLTPPSNLPPALKSLLQSILHFDYKKRPTFAQIREKLVHMQESAISAIEADLDEFFGLRFE